MAGLWTVPTVLIVAAAEATLTLLPVWEPVGVTTVGGFAPYILPPEMLLGWMMFAGGRWTRTGPRRAVVAVTGLIALAYAGAATVSWLLVERGLLGS